MTPGPKYASGTALRTALEERLKRESRDQGIDLQRLRRKVAFDRFLARLFREPDSGWVFHDAIRAVLGNGALLSTSVQKFGNVFLHWAGVPMSRDAARKIACATI